MTFRHRPHRTWLVLATLASAGLLGCETGSTQSTRPLGQSFVSDNPNGATPPQGTDDYGEGEGGGSSGTGAGTGGGGGSGGANAGGDDPERAIAEADIIQIDGGKLYALSQYSGLSVIDVSVQDELELLGRYPLSGDPFEMYLRNGVVYAMFSSWGQYVYDETTGVYGWVQTSHVEALDVSNPADIQSIGAFDLPGSISDSRIVGDVLYAVTFEDGYCWECQPAPNTTITSLDVADPASIAVVDQLSYADDDPYGYGWRRSVTVTTDRMYVAGIEWDGGDQGHSTIQVIDISDPSGQLEQGATVEAAGQIQSRWQMDEHEGVLRVISQPGIWWSDAMPGVQTFSIVSSHQVQPLGYTELQLPMPETLRSVRFDGARAYAITAEQTDPLFTIDLSDPANPQQVGELEIPGWVYHMEPRGDRLLALGFDNADPDGSLHVSLFDVADLTQPTMIERVAFGGDWSNVAEDQDRIHKAFKILDDEGLILVPYSGWEYTDDYGCGSFHSGIQLVDFTTSSLTLRGVAPSRGQARRAFLHQDRLFAVSDEEVRTFDIDDRDAPAAAERMALATVVNKSAPMGDLVVRLAADWWTSEAMLEVASASAPGTPEPIGAVDLSPLFGESQEGCYGWYFWDAKLFTHEQHAWLVWPSNDWTRTRVATIDLTDPTAPKIAGELELAMPIDLYGYWYYGPAVWSGDTVVQVGSSLVLRHLSQDAWSYDNTTVHPAWLEVVDLSNPAQPVHAATVDLPGGAGHTGLRVDGTDVLTSHWVPLPEDTTKARFYFDRIDVSDPASPDVHAPINVPGSLVAFDAATSRLLTVDYQRVVQDNTTPYACWDTFGYDAQWEPANPDQWDGPGTCKAMRRSFKLAQVHAAGASLLDAHPLEDGTQLSSLFVGEDRAFAMASNSSWYEENGPYWSSTRMMVVGGMSDGALQVEFFAGEELADAYPVAADGARLVTASYSPPAVQVLDATDMDALVYETKGEISAYIYHVSVEDGVALCSMGPYGLEAVNID